MWCRRSDNRRRPYRKHLCCRIQRIFDIAVLIKKIRKIHEHTGFIEFGDL